MFQGRRLQEPPSTVGPALMFLFLCLFAMADTFCLLDEFFFRRHYFKNNMPFTYAMLTAVGVTMTTTMVINFLTIFPSRKTRRRGYLAVLFMCVVLTTAPYLVLRIWLFIVHGCFTENLMQSGFFVFIVAEAVVLVMGVVDFAMEMKRWKRHHKSQKSIQGLEKWRNYSRGLRPESESSGISTSPQGHVNIGGDFGDTSDGFSSDDDSSNQDDVFYTKTTNQGQSEEAQTSGADSSHLAIPAHEKLINHETGTPVKLFYTKPVNNPEDDQYTASLYNNAPQYNAYTRDPPAYTKPSNTKHGNNEYKPQNVTKETPAASTPVIQPGTGTWYQKKAAARTPQKNPKDQGDSDPSGGFHTFRNRQSREDLINEAVRDFKPKYTEDELKNMVFYI